MMTGKNRISYFVFCTYSYFNFYHHFIKITIISLKYCSMDEYFPGILPPLLLIFRIYISLSLISLCCIFYQSRIKWYYFPKKLRWSGGETDHPTRPHTILKNTKTEERSPLCAFLFFSMVWGRVGCLLSPLHLRFSGTK